MEKYLQEKELSLHVTLDTEKVYKNADYIIVATPRGCKKFGSVK